MTSPPDVRDRFFVAMYQAVEPVGEARSDFDIFSGLAERLGVADKYTEGQRRDGLAASHVCGSAKIG